MPAAIDAGVVDAGIVPTVAGVPSATVLPTIVLPATVLPGIELVAWPPVAGGAVLSLESPELHATSAIAESVAANVETNRRMVAPPARAQLRRTWRHLQ
jgi:hypothetical protein